MGTPEQSAASRPDLLKSASNLGELRAIRQRLEQELGQLQADAKGDIMMNLEKVLAGIQELGRLREYLEAAVPGDGDCDSPADNAGEEIAGMTGRIALADSKPDAGNATQ